MNANGTLGDALVRIHRSLLQYVRECWPWTPGSGELALIQTLATKQSVSVTQIAELLSARGEYVEFGVYPATYTDLHYVSLKYLLKQIAIDEKKISSKLEGLVLSCIHDPQAASLLKEVAAREREVQSEIGRMTAPSRSA